MTTQERTPDGLHRLEYSYWQTHGMNLSETARHFNRNIKTIRAWRDAEQWARLTAEAQAAVAIEVAQEQAAGLQQHLRDGSLAVEGARINHERFQQSVSRLAAACQAVFLATQGCAPAEVLSAVKRSGIELLGQLTALDARITATLYPAQIPQHIEVQSTAPGDLLALDRASLAEFARLTETELQDGMDQLIKDVENGSDS